MAVKAMMTTEVYLPWASSSAEPSYDDQLPDFPAGAGFAVHFVEITCILHGKAGRTRSLNIPSKLTCADLKGQIVSLRAK